MYFDYKSTSWLFKICLPTANVGCLRNKQIKEREMWKTTTNDSVPFHKYAIDNMKLSKSISQAVKPKMLNNRKLWMKIKMKWETGDKKF